MKEEREKLVENLQRIHQNINSNATDSTYRSLIEIEFALDYAPSNENIIVVTFKCVAESLNNQIIVKLSMECIEYTIS